MKITDKEKQIFLSMMDTETYGLTYSISLMGENFAQKILAHEKNKITEVGEISEKVILYMAVAHELCEEGILVIKDEQNKTFSTSIIGAVAINEGYKKFKRRNRKFFLSWIEEHPIFASAVALILGATITAIVNFGVEIFKENRPIEINISSENESTPITKSQLPCKCNPVRTDYPIDSLFDLD